MKRLSVVHHWLFLGLMLAGFSAILKTSTERSFEDLVMSRKPYDADLLMGSMANLTAPQFDRSMWESMLNQHIINPHRFTVALIYTEDGRLIYTNESEVKFAVPRDVSDRALGISLPLYRGGSTGDLRRKAQERYRSQVTEETYGITIAQTRVFERPYYAILITNIGDAIEKDSGLLQNQLALRLVTMAGAATVIAYSQLRSKYAILAGIRNSQPIVPRWDWTREAATIAETFNQYLAQEKESQLQLASSYSRLEVANTELGTANTELEQLYRSLRHDIVSNIKGVSDSITLLMLSGFIPPPEHAPMFDLLKDKSRIAYQLVSNTGKLGEPLKFEPVSISDIFADIKTIFASENLITAPPTKDIFINVDRNAFILRILSNLITNAIRYSPPDSEVTLGLKDKGDRVTIFVQDRGSGLTESEIEIVLNNYGSSARLQPDIEGTGTGLHTVQQVLKQHNLVLKVKSKKGIGSLFYVEIPKVLN